MKKYSYSITNDKQIAPKFKCCPICLEEINIIIRYESFNVDFFCNKCGFDGSINYIRKEEWTPEVEGNEVKF